MRGMPMQRKFKLLKSGRHRGKGRSLQRLFAASVILLICLGFSGCGNPVYHPMNPPPSVLLGRIFKKKPFEKKDEFAYSFAGLIIAIDRGVYQKTGTQRRFIIHWGAVNRSSQVKYLALSPANSYILAGDDTTLRVSATGIVSCSQNHYQRTGCKDYTSIWPGQTLLFFTSATGNVDAETIGLRARFVMHGENQKFGARTQPQNIEVEFHDIGLDEEAWKEGG